MPLRHLNDEVWECVNQASGAQQPIAEAYRFVRELVEQKGWSEMDARQVGARALSVLDAYAGRDVGSMSR